MSVSQTVTLAIPARVGSLRKLLRGLVVNMPRDVFRRRVQRVERRKLIQVLVIERPDHFLDHALQVDEIVEQPVGVELLAGEDHAHFVIVAVQILAFSLVIAQVVGRGKCFVNADFVHGLSFWQPKNARYSGSDLP